MIIFYDSENEELIESISDEDENYSKEPVLLSNYELEKDS